MIGLLTVVLFILIFAGFPVAMAMGFSSMVGILIDPSVDALVVAQKIFVANDTFTLLAVPLFMLSGQIMERTGIMDRIFDLAKAIVGWMRGGIAYTTVLAGVLMAGISGSAYADAAAMASMTLPTLRKDGWDDGTSVCIVAAAAAWVHHSPQHTESNSAAWTNMSVGKMFMAGVLPGLILAVIVYDHHRHQRPRRAISGARGSWVSRTVVSPSSKPFPRCCPGHHLGWP